MLLFWNAFNYYSKSKTGNEGMTDQKCELRIWQINPQQRVANSNKILKDETLTLVNSTSEFDNVSGTLSVLEDVLHDS